MVYRFIDNNKDHFGLKWLCIHLGISLNSYYNYLKDNKGDYYLQREVIFKRIKYIFYNNNRTIGHRAMKIFLSRYGIYLSKTTVHKYMNKILNLAAVIMRKNLVTNLVKNIRYLITFLNKILRSMKRIKYGVPILHI